MRCRILATTLAFLLAGISLPGQTASLGVITQSSGGHLNSGAGSAGTTIYDSDRLSTEPGGSLTMSSGSVQLTLAEDTAVLINRDGSAISAMLQRGSVAFKVEGTGTLRINAVDVRVQAQSNQPTAGQVTLENCAVVVTSRVQSLEVAAAKETKIIEAGQSYRVALVGGACGNQAKRAPVIAAQGRFLAVPVAIGIITIIGVHKALESPDRP